MINLEGIIPPLPTAFHQDEELFPEKIRENAGKLLKTGLAGILVLGSNGELVMLSEGEKEQVYAIARETVPQGKLLIAGTGGQSTRETIRLTGLAAKHGADAALVLNPFYYRGLMSGEVLRKHYQEVADASEIPVIIYNMPANTGIDMDADTLLRIAEHPNIVGLKDSGGDMVKMGQLIREAPGDFRVLAGSAGFLLPALLLGASGGILALANVFPRVCLDLLAAFLEGEMETAVKIQRSIVKLNTAVTRKWGVPALKAAMDQVGFYGGPVRRPLRELKDPARTRVVKLLRELE